MVESANHRLLFHEGQHRNSVHNVDLLDLLDQAQLALALAPFLDDHGLHNLVLAPERVVGRVQPLGGECVRHLLRDVSDMQARVAALQGDGVQHLEYRRPYPTPRPKLGFQRRTADIFQTTIRRVDRACSSKNGRPTERCRSARHSVIAAAEEGSSIRG
ncbi:hypothetical protein G6F22_019982 [Rhizopus arrhizus]|nr:hypothetical protein G6F22_019982 [Rhizopus arrhizus]